MLSRLKSSLIASAALALIATIPAQAQALPGKSQSIIMIRPSWNTGWFRTEIYSQLLRELGYAVSELMMLDNPAFYQSVGYGDVTMWVDGHVPGHTTSSEFYEHGAEVVGVVVPKGSIEGYLVDRRRLSGWGSPRSGRSGATR